MPTPTPTPTPTVPLSLRLDPAHYVDDIAAIRQAVIANGTTQKLGAVTVTSPVGGSPVVVYFIMAFRAATAANPKGIDGSLYTWAFGSSTGPVYTTQPLAGITYTIANQKPFPTQGGLKTDYGSLGCTSSITTTGQQLVDAVKTMSTYAGGTVGDTEKMAIARLSVALSEAVRLNAVRDAVLAVLKPGGGTTANLKPYINNWGGRGIGV